MPLLSPSIRRHCLKAAAPSRPLGTGWATTCKYKSHDWVLSETPKQNPKGLWGHDATGQ